MTSIAVKTDSPTVFFARSSELTDRFDPEIVLFRRKLHRFRYPIHKIREFLSESPQYGAGERGVVRETESQPRYIRITDIDDYGILTDELGVTTETVEARYLVQEDDLLLARSGNTVGKSYLHKRAHAPYECLFAGYLIRFRFKHDHILPEYVFALTQLPYYKEWVRAVRRAAGQPNINAQEYSSLEIPVPPIPVQARVIALLQEAYTKRRRREAEARNLIRSINDVVLTALDISETSERSLKIGNRTFRKSFFELTGKRWDPNYALCMGSFLNEIKRCPYPCEPLRESLAFVQYGISERATEEVVGIPMLRMLNLQGGAWNLSNMKYIAMSDHERRPFLLERGDILFNRTNSKELVGKCNVFDLEGEYVFASYLMRARLRDDARLLPEYVVAYMACSLGRLQIDAVSRQIAGMTNVNAEELRELLIPIPPRSVQSRICKRVAQIREKAGELQTQAVVEFEAAKEEIESLVFEEIVV